MVLPCDVRLWHAYPRDIPWLGYPSSLQWYLAKQRRQVYQGLLLLLRLQLGSQ